jgi:alpha-methylacyl-CoA racemase
MGPLQGVRVVEFAGIGPAPFGSMVLADMGADVLVINRKTLNPQTANVPLYKLGGQAALNRGKRSIALDLKKPTGIETALRLLERADALIEGFRPGVMERNGLGPTTCLARNRRLVYGRMTGWGQTGPLAQAAGHDLNYLALSGGLSLGAQAGGQPWAPPAVLGDMAGGGLLLALGIVSAILETRTSGRGQIVDAAITDGAALLTTVFHALRAAGVAQPSGRIRALDSSAPFYSTYRCADGKWIAIGAVEPQFYAVLLERCGLTDVDPDEQWHEGHWQSLSARLAALITTRTQAEWCRLLEGTDACVAPVLDLQEAPAHPHNRARRSFIEMDSIVQPAPAPRFSRTVSEIRPPPNSERPENSMLADWGLSGAEVSALRKEGVLG